MIQFKYLNRNKRDNLPKATGVYAFKQGKNFLYIGKAVDIKQRVKNHFQQPGFRDSFFLRNIEKIGYIETNSEIEALLLEAELIKKHQPKYNVVWKDNKNYFFVSITKEEWPRVFVTHQIQMSKSKCQIKSKIQMTNCLGPFVDGKTVRQALKMLRRVFPFRTCKTLPEKKCLFYELKLCPGPCEEKLPKKEYQRNISSVVKILQGKRQQALRNLKKEMKAASGVQNFEKAAQIRNQIFALENVFLHSHILRKEVQEPVEWQKTEKTLQKLLCIKTKIKRMEGYDVSNIQGKEATGSMVVFEKGVPNKNEYRKFHIKIEGKPNDVAMLKEVLMRRFNHPEWKLPDSIIIDGGKAQLNTALKLKMKNEKLKTTNKNLKRIKIISLAKRQNELFIEGKQNTLLLKNLPQDISNLVLRIRDEAHRFAVTYHKKLREKDFFI